jgi:hypothetical protein
LQDSTSTRVRMSCMSRTPSSSTSASWYSTWIPACSNEAGAARACR